MKTATIFVPPDEFQNFGLLSKRLSNVTSLLKESEKEIGLKITGYALKLVSTNRDIELVFDPFASVDKTLMSVISEIEDPGIRKILIRLSDTTKEKVFQDLLFTGFMSRIFKTPLIEEISLEENPYTT